MSKLTPAALPAEHHVFDGFPRMEQEGGLGRRDEHPHLAQLARLEVLEYASNHGPEDVQPRGGPHRLFPLPQTGLRCPDPLGEQALRSLGPLP